MNLNREGKIKLLKELASGKMNLSELKPKEFLIKIRPEHKGGSLFFINNQEVIKDEFNTQLKVQMKYENIQFHVRRVNFETKSGSEFQ